MHTFFAFFLNSLSRLFVLQRGTRIRCRRRFSGTGLILQALAVLSAWQCTISLLGQKSRLVCQTNRTNEKISNYSRMENRPFALHTHTHIHANTYIPHYVPRALPNPVQYINRSNAQLSYPRVAILISYNASQRRKTRTLVSLSCYFCSANQCAFVALYRTADSSSSVTRHHIFSIFSIYRIKIFCI